VRQVEDYRHVGMLEEELLPHSRGGNDRHARDRAQIHGSKVEVPEQCLLLLSLQGMAPDLEIRTTCSAVGKVPRQGLKAKTWCVLVSAASGSPERWRHVDQALEENWVISATAAKPSRR
jgi:hypothetical protein